VSFYRERVYPALVTALGDPDPVQAVRTRVVRQARGEVLEIGVGPGVNFRHYDPALVARLYALEPNAGMRKYAEGQRLRTALDVRFLDLPGERIPLDDASVDTVVSTFTLCTIPGVVEALRGVRRVLRPQGRFLFFEHGRSPDPRLRRWQRWTEPMTRWVFEGCHLTRDIPSLIENGGFRIESMETAYLARFPKSWTHCFWGTAVPAAS
jgi:ubiquinone/menaquinone biosynthesis C-methylase UbiE